MKMFFGFLLILGSIIAISALKKYEWKLSFLENDINIIFTFAGLVLILLGLIGLI